VPGLPVDRHVLRVANRIGIAESDDPVVVEHQLGDALPKERWTRTSDTLILHGRRICRPKPLCDACVVRDACDFYQTVIARQRGRASTKDPASAHGASSERRPGKRKGRRGHKGRTDRKPRKTTRT
jgi:endonuclease III